MLDWFYVLFQVICTDVRLVLCIVSGYVYRCVDWFYVLFQVICTDVRLVLCIVSSYMYRR